MTDFTFENSVPAEPTCPCVNLHKEAADEELDNTSRCIALSQAHDLATKFCKNPDCIHWIKADKLRIDHAILENDKDEQERSCEDFAIEAAPEVTHQLEESNARLIAAKTGKHLV